MIDEITYAVQQELLSLFSVGGATVILETDFDKSGWPTYMMPLVLIVLGEDEDYAQMIGGRTRCAWDFSLNVYNHRPDVSGMDPTDYSARTTEIWDTVRRHFSNFSVFQTDEMKKAYTCYDLRWTLSSVMPAESLPHPDGLCMGTKTTFFTVSWDSSTDGTKLRTPLQAINQLPPPPVV